MKETLHELYATRIDALQLNQLGKSQSPNGADEKSVRLRVNQAKIDAGEGPTKALTTADKEEIRRLQRELKRVTAKRNRLKKRQ